MAYSLRATHIQQLYGSEFLCGEHRFEIQLKDVYRARSGLDGYGLRAHHKHPDFGTIVAFLKFFRVDVPERKNRTLFLMDWAYRKKRRYLDGVPYAYIENIKIGGIDVIGHLSKFAGASQGRSAQDFSELKETWSGTSNDRRHSLAIQLALTIKELENDHITHGDVSSSNFLISDGPDESTLGFLCDFDGFHHAQVARLPRKHNGQLVRPLGSIGYQHPRLIELLGRDSTDEDDEIQVETDRFALAVLAIELIVWENDFRSNLGRAELLSDRMLQDRSIADLPNDIVDRFPEGFALLQKAFNSRGLVEMPSPQDWINVLRRSERVLSNELSRPPAHRAKVRIDDSLSLSKQNNSNRAAGRVFVSYSKNSIASTQGLVKMLEREGYDVWWDARLTAGEVFEDVIRSEIRSAAAVIVIWTPNSIASRYVKSEARFADSLKKMVQVVADGVGADDLPFPFDGNHYEPIENESAIIRALDRLNVPRRPQAKDEINNAIINI